MDTTLYIYLLDDFKLTYDNVPISAVESSRMQELLTYLILHRNAAQSRQYLSFLFWPDSSDKQARTNLRQLLHHLHLKLPAAKQYITSNGKTIQWNTQAHCIADVEQFEQFLLQARNADKAHVSEEYYRKGIELYKGDLLKTCYSEWITLHRERLQREYTKALEEVVQLLEKKRDYTTAIGYATQLLEADLLHEPVYRLLMGLHAGNNDRAGALKVYQKCIQVLQAELGVEPDKDTKAIYNRLLINESVNAASKNIPSGALHQDLWPLVGRHQEWEALQKCWNQCLSGSKHLALIQGEPGIGKTRLAHEFLHWADKQGYKLAHARCYEAAGALTYAPITDLLNTAAIRSKLSTLNPIWLSEIARLLPDLLIEQQLLVPPGPLTEGWQRLKFFEALSRAFTSDGTPKILYIDDLQWCDQETLSWLQYFLHFEKGTKVLLMATMRSSEYLLNQPLKKLLTDLQREQLLLTIPLLPLDEQETLLLAKQVINEPDDNIDLNLYKETEGNPLFIIESIRNSEFETKNHIPAVLNSYYSSVSALSPKVGQVIAARFAKLSSEAKEIMNISAVIGREFSFEVLKNASNMVERDIIYALEELMQHYIIREQHSGDFDFSHDKLREVAYAGMSHTRKRWLHRTVAETIEKIHVKHKTMYSNRLAYHYDHAGLTEKAIHYYSIAARGAQQIFANYEAVSFLKRAIALVQELPKNNDVSQLEISLQTSLAITLVPLKGYGTDEVYQFCEQVRMMSKSIGEAPNDRLLRTLAINRVVNADFLSGYELGLELLSQAEQTSNHILLVEAHYVLGASQGWRGNYNEAKFHLNEVLNLYDPGQSETHIRLYGQDPAVVCRVRLANVLLALGQVEEAEEEGIKSLEEGMARGHLFSLTYVRNWLAWLYNLQGKIIETKLHAEEAIAYSKFEYPYWNTLSNRLLGWSLTEQGERAKGIEILRENSNLAYLNGSSAGLPYFWCLLANALADQGKFEEAFDLIEKAQSQINHTGERWLESEHYRIKGEIISKRSPADKASAQTCFEQAVNIARQQGARYFEQKANMCLSRTR